ncbi:MAG: hypothetical protein H6711_13505 [Myxococcales bacterium]|nr:hypothetical protein [Myxococcales bacterium]
MDNYRWKVAAILVALAIPGCDQVEDDGVYDNSLTQNFVDDEGRLQWRNVEDNGIELNGRKFNGIKFNGVNLNNPSVGANNTVVATDPDTQEELAGQDLENARIDIEEDDENEVPVAREVAVINIEPPTADGLVVQELRVRTPPSTDWANACEDGHGNPTKAISLRGNWDMETGERLESGPSDATWACLGAALADCAFWGYVPGKVVGGEDLWTYHYTCTRLKRADYCGVGLATTRNGTQIDVFDRKHIQDSETNWPIEGCWNTDGAICLSHTRKTDWTKSNPPEPGKQYIGCEIPDCVDANADGNYFDDYPTALLCNLNVQTDPPA